MSDPDGALSSYAEVIAVIEALPVLVRETRRRRGLSLRQAARNIGSVEASTLHRFEGGQQIHSGNLLALLRWVGTPDSDVTETAQ